MISDKDVEHVREHFVRASHEFGFKIVMPFRIDEEESLFAFAYLPDYGSSNGAIVDLIGPMNVDGDKRIFKGDNRIIEWARNHDCFYSSLYIKPLLGEYDGAYFMELLDDWKIENPRIS